MLRVMAQRKNAAAVALGRRRAKLAAPGEMSEIGKAGGSVGGPARARSLSKARRRAIAKEAAAARWGKKEGKS
jgi:hypothetical protein